ncbi:hypothetical protein [Micromonospora sp. NPDC092111]|uniref:hypothetical protein n=1 Tax=Micromonospora sp. NPDC092111 TaxID=3364289 RepID=UPI00382E5AA3
MKRTIARAVALLLVFGVLATSGAASASPICETNPMGCEPPPPPPPPARTDKAPTGAAQATGVQDNGILGITGWATDSNGGPVTVDITFDGALVASKPASDFRVRLPAGPIGFTHTVVVPPTGPVRRLCATARNVPDGSTPAAPSVPLGCVDSRPSKPTDLVLSAESNYNRSTLRLAWTDNATDETSYLVTLSYLRRHWEDNYSWLEPVTASIVVPAQPGTGRMSLVLADQDANTHFQVLVNSRVGEITSETLSGAVTAP